MPSSTSDYLATLADSLTARADFRTLIADFCGANRENNYSAGQIFILLFVSVILQIPRPSLLCLTR